MHMHRVIICIYIYVSYICCDNVMCVLGYQLKESQTVVDYLLDIVSEQASLRTFGDRKGAVLSLEDLAELRKTMVSIRHGSSDATMGSEASDTGGAGGDPEGGEGTANKNPSISAAMNAINATGSSSATWSRVLVPIEGIALGPAARVLALRRWLTAYRTVHNNKYDNSSGGVVLYMYIYVYIIYLYVIIFDLYLICDK